MRCNVGGGGSARGWSRAGRGVGDGSGDGAFGMASEGRPHPKRCAGPGHRRVAGSHGEPAQTRLPYLPPGPRRNLPLSPPERLLALSSLAYLIKKKKNPPEVPGFPQNFPHAPPHLHRRGSLPIACSALPGGVLQQRTVCPGLSTRRDLRPPSPSSPAE